MAIYVVRPLLKQQCDIIGRNSKVVIKNGN